MIEIGASTLVTWHLRDTADQARERRALRLIGFEFVGLAIYVSAQAAYSLVAADRPHHTVPGIAWTAATCAAMAALALAKGRTGRAIDNQVLLTESRVILIDAYLAAAVLVGLLLNAVVGWWWADPLAGAGGRLLRAPRGEGGPRLIAEGDPDDDRQPLGRSRPGFGHPIRRRSAEDDAQYEGGEDGVVELAGDRDQVRDEIDGADEV
jgi:hypothetical protein